VKERVSKRYRHPDLDKKLNKQRLHQEARCMAKCLKTGIACPGIYLVDSKSFRIYMEHVVGVTVKQLIWSIVTAVKSEMEEVSFESPVLVEIAKSIGLLIRKLHGIRMIHGDLTTSNMMVRRRSPGASTGSVDADGCAVIDSVAVQYRSFKNSQLVPDATAYEVVLIDFGLGKMQASVEDMAVDLYVLERAFTSTHPGCEPFLANILSGYENGAACDAVAGTDDDAGSLRVGNPNKVGSTPVTAKLIKEVVEKLEVVRMRGRKRDMVG
jgi:TP53 regulating kinase and related kinases